MNQMGTIKGREIKPIGLDFDDLNLIMDPACFEKTDTHQGNEKLSDQRGILR